jgi:hypothetical protein
VAAAIATSEKNIKLAPNTDPCAAQHILRAFQGIALSILETVQQRRLQIPWDFASARRPLLGTLMPMEEPNKASKAVIGRSVYSL